MKSKNVLQLILLSLVLVISARAQAITIGFAADPNAFITSYAGFNWTGGSGASSWVNGTVHPLSGAPSTSLGYAWSNGGTNLEFSLATPGTFTFNSIGIYADSNLWGGAPSVLTIEGYASGILMETFVTPVLDGLPRGVFHDFLLDWSNIDTVKFSEVPNENILLTDLRFNEAIGSVPTPATLALFGLGLLAFGWSRRKA